MNRERPKCISSLLRGILAIEAPAVQPNCKHLSNALLLERPVVSVSQTHIFLENTQWTKSVPLKGTLTILTSKPPQTLEQVAQTQYALQGKRQHKQIYNGEHTSRQYIWRRKLASSRQTDNNIISCFTLLKHTSPLQKHKPLPNQLAAQKRTDYLVTLTFCHCTLARWQEGDLQEIHLCTPHCISSTLPHFSYRFISQ